MSTLFITLLAASAALRLPTAVDQARTALSRRGALLSGLALPAALVASNAPLLPAVAAMPRRTELAEVALDELPPGAATAYRQYWPAMQLAADFYAFELRGFIADPQKWDLVGAIMESKSTGSAQSPSRLEREFVSPMRILALAFPPDLGGEPMQKSLDRFQQTMFKLSKYRASPAGTETPSTAAPLALWEQGREELNEFLGTMNSATESTRMVQIPPKAEGYPRSKTLYTQLMKDSALCRNRGGQALAGIWGQLMVYGTAPGVQPCGSVNLETYFAQGQAAQ